MSIENKMINISKLNETTSPYILGSIARVRYYDELGYQGTFEGKISDITIVPNKEIYFRLESNEFMFNFRKTFIKSIKILKFFYGKEDIGVNNKYMKEIIS